MIAELGRPAEKLFQCIIKNGKCSNLEDLLSKCENAAELVNTNFDGLYPIHIISLRSRDQDLERKLRLVIKHGANIYLKGFQGLTGKFKLSAIFALNFFQLVDISKTLMIGGNLCTNIKNRFKIVCNFFLLMRS